jgi:hypothetical protein
MNNFILEDINYCCDKQKIQNIVYLVNRKILSITTCMLIYIGIFITSAILVNQLIIFNVLPRILYFVYGYTFDWFMDIIFGIVIRNRIMSTILMLCIKYSINIMLILIVLKESMHLIKTVKCNCYNGFNSRNERGVYNGEVYSDDDDDEDEDEDDEVYNDVQDGISNSAQ